MFAAVSRPVGDAIARARAYFRGGAKLLVLSQVAENVLRLGGNVVLTRLLAPEAYGVVAVVTSISYVLTMISDMGLRAYVIRHKDANPELLQSVWTVRLLRNSALAAIMFFGAPFFAAAYSAPEVVMAVRICALLYLFEASASLSPALNERRRRVNLVTIVQFLVFIATLATTIIAAYFLRNYWAIIISMFVRSALTVVVSYMIYRGPAPGFRFNAEHFRDLWKFWRVIIPASIISIFLTQTDRFFIANYLSLTELGKFSLAATLASAAAQMSQQYVFRIFFPTYSEAVRETPEDLRKAYYAPRRATMQLFAFLIGGLAGSAEFVTRLLFNDEYLGAGVYLTLLCLSPIAKLSTFPAEQALIATGFVRASLTSNIARLIWVAVAAPAGFYFFGVLGLVAAISLADAALAPYLWAHLRRRDIFRLEEEAPIFALAAAGCGVGLAGQQLIFALVERGILPAF